MNQFELGAKVKSPQDKSLGSIKYLVANAEDNQITHLIVETGELAPRQIVVDKKWVGDLAPDGKSVILNLNEEQLKEMPDFIEREYIAPNETYPLVNDPSNITAPTGYLYPSMQSAAPAGTLNSEMAFAQGLVKSPENQPYTEKVNVPENSLIIKEGAQVDALDGNVGKVKKVNLNPESGQLDSFLVEKGFFFKDEYLVPIEYVETATEAKINLNLSRDQMERLG
jgi:uncharacterized protein YrrD